MKKVLLSSFMIGALLISAPTSLFAYPLITPATSLSSGANEPRYGAVADFDDDGYDDLIVGHTAGTAYSIFQGSSAGLSFHSSSTTNGGNLWIRNGDFNNDDIPDFAILDGTADQFEVFIGDGSFGFTGTTIAVDSATHVGFFVADLNNDDYDDLVASDTNGGELIQIALNDQDGTYTYSTTSPGTTNVQRIVAGFFDADSDIDLAVADFTTNETRVYIGNGDGTFDAGTSYNLIPVSPTRIDVADFNQDGSDDLIINSAGVTSFYVALSDGDGTFAAATAYTAPENLIEVQPVEINNDEYPDILVTQFGTDDATIFLNDGDGTFTQDQELTVGDFPYEGESGDFNNDGANDLVVFNANDDTISVFYGTPEEEEEEEDTNENNNGRRRGTVVRDGWTDSFQKPNFNTDPGNPDVERLQKQIKELIEQIIKLLLEEIKNQ